MKFWQLTALAHCRLRSSRRMPQNSNAAATLDAFMMFDAFARWHKLIKLSNEKYSTWSFLEPSHCKFACHLPKSRNQRLLFLHLTEKVLLSALSLVCLYVASTKLYTACDHLQANNQEIWNFTWTSTCNSLICKTIVSIWWSTNRSA